MDMMSGEQRVILHGCHLEEMFSSADETEEMGDSCLYTYTVLCYISNCTICFY